MGSHFLQPYYVANALMCGAYFVARQWWLTAGRDPRYSKVGNIDELAHWERNLYALIFTAVMYKVFKFRSAAAFAGDAFKYARMITAVGLFMMDYRLLALYLLALYAVFLVLPEPWYCGADKIQYLTAENFKDTVLAAGEDVEGYYLVEFYTEWSADCKALAQGLAQLSLKYTSSTLQFGKVDLGQWPSLALEMKIDTSPSSTQLPTLVLFKGGKVVTRMPHQPSKQPFVSGTSFRKADIERVFELSKRSRAS